MKTLLAVLGAIVIAGAGFVAGMYYKTNTCKTTKCPTSITESSSSVRVAATAQKTTVDSSSGIKVTSPAAGSKITSPIEISGEALGNWFFEGEFAVSLLDSSGKMITDSIVKAQDEWMTEGYVPFLAYMDFPDQPKGSGYLMFNKNNPSGLASGNAEYKVKISF